MLSIRINEDTLERRDGLVVAQLAQDISKLVLEQRRRIFET